MVLAAIELPKFEGSHCAIYVEYIRPKVSVRLDAALITPECSEIRCTNRFRPLYFSNRARERRQLPARLAGERLYPMAVE